MAVGALVGLPLNWAGEQGLIDAEVVTKVARVGKEVGDLFLKMLQMLVVPLVVSSLIAGITGMGNLRELGTLGARTIGFYLGTSLLAIITGIALVNIINPGEGTDLELLGAEVSEHVQLQDQAGEDLGTVLWTQAKKIVPRNPLAAAVEGDMLPLIFFSLLLGIFISVAEHSGKSPHAKLLREFFTGLFDVMMRMTLFVIWFAPVGVLGFMLYAAAGKGLSVFGLLGLYALTVFLGLVFHAGVTLPVILRVFGDRSPVAHMRAMKTALLTAFGTASSNGTLPLTIQCVEQEAGVKPQVSAFVLPLGATINMDGTALYEAVAVLFIAQVYGVDLDLAGQVVVALTALLASVGAAGIPHAGTVMMVVVLSAVGLPTTAVGLILAVDRVLDMCRTTVNVWSDSIAAVVVDRHAH